MYGNGGVAYVYLCYGIHHLFNIVTNDNGYTSCYFNPFIGTVKGIEEMLRRTGKGKT